MNELSQILPDSLEVKSKAVAIEDILALENEILKHPQVELPLTHDFINGIYARSMFIPAGTVLTGAVHAFDCFSVMRYGDLIIYTEDGMREVHAGDMIPSGAGIKRAGYAITDTLITGFMANPTNETDLDKLWEMYTSPNETLLAHESTELLEKH
jgi:hypothetical protein